MLRGLFKNRYGVDHFSISLAILSLGFVFSRFFWPIGLALLAYAIFRASSKNFAKRQMELQKYYTFIYKISISLNKVFGPIVRYVKFTITRIKNRKDYKYLKCRYCKKKLKLPRNKGKLKVTCPNCKNQFITKT